MKQADEIAASIGFWVYETTECVGEADKITEATRRVTNLGIVDITFDDGVATIHTSCPGIVIGYHGDTIKAITDYVKKNSKFVIQSVSVVEHKLPTSLFCFRALWDYDFRNMEYSDEQSRLTIVEGDNAKAVAP